MKMATSKMLVLVLWTEEDRYSIILERNVQYKEGNTMAKFNSKYYPAKVIKKSDNKEELEEYLCSITSSASGAVGEDNTKKKRKPVSTTTGEKKKRVEDSGDKLLKTRKSEVKEMKRNQLTSSLAAAKVMAKRITKTVFEPQNPEQPVPHNQPPAIQPMSQQSDLTHTLTQPNTQQLNMPPNTQQLDMPPNTPQLNMPPNTQQLDMPPNTPQLNMPPNTQLDMPPNTQLDMPQSFHSVPQQSQIPHMHALQPLPQNSDSTPTFQPLQPTQQSQMPHIFQHLSQNSDLTHTLQQSLPHRHKPLSHAFQQQDMSQQPDIQQMQPYNHNQTREGKSQTGHTNHHMDQEYHSSLSSCLQMANNTLHQTNITLNETDSINNIHNNFDTDHSHCQARIRTLEDKVAFLESNLLKEFLGNLSTEVSSKLPNVGLGTSTSFPSYGAPSDVLCNYAAPIASSTSNGEAPTSSNCVAPSTSSTNSFGPVTQGDHESLCSPSVKQTSQVMELYPGSGVQISANQLNLCRRKAKDSPTAMARLLLLVYFDTKTLSESCAKGTSKRKPLNQEILDAIVQFCLDYRKGKVTEKDIIQAINNKCSDVRQSNKL